MLDKIMLNGNKGNSLDVIDKAIASTKKPVPISLGSFLFTRMNDQTQLASSREKKDGFMNLCQELSQDSKRLTSDIAGQIIDYLQVSKAQNYLELISLINKWRVGQWQEH